MSSVHSVSQKDKQVSVYMYSAEMYLSKLDLSTASDCLSRDTRVLKNYLLMIEETPVISHGWTSNFIGKMFEIAS